MYYDALRHSSLAKVAPDGPFAPPPMDNPPQPAGGFAAQRGQGTQRFNPHTSSVDEIVPVGWRLKDQLLDGVPNWVLYASAGVVVWGLLRKKR